MKTNMMMVSILWLLWQWYAFNNDTDDNGVDINDETDENGVDINDVYW